MENNYPPYTITDKMLNYVSEIMKKVGEANYFESLNRYPELRRKTRIKSIHSSLAIENNQLSLFQVEDVINGKPVIGEQKDIQEVKNAYEAYEQIDKINPYSVEDLKKIHKTLTFLIEKDAGKFRNHGECVRDGERIIFVAPPENMVNPLMNQLFDWMRKSKETVNPLILSCIFHYEFVFIHPFHDGNGRTARLWQTAILSHWEKAFTYLPIESMIKKNQEEYYTAIQNCNNVGKSNEFIEFMLKIISETIDEIMNSKEMKDKSYLLLSESESKVLECIKRNVIIGAKDIIEQTKLSDSTVRRILRKFLINEKIETTNDNEKSPNKKYKMTE
jgi:Fic family protein